MKVRSSASRIAWLAILAMIWHALLPLAHAASAAGAQRGVLSSICTTGPARQEIFNLPAERQEAPAVDLLKQCPLCASGAHAALPETSPAGFKPDARLVHVQSHRRLSTATQPPAWLNFSPRAPPCA